MLHKICITHELQRLIRCSLLIFGMAPPLAANADATSTLVVVIKPQRAIDDGARWRHVANGIPSQWYTSSQKVTGLDDGDLVIEAGQPQQGSTCKAPNKEIVEIRPGRSHIRELDYTSGSCR